MLEPDIYQVTKDELVARAEHKLSASLSLYRQVPLYAARLKAPFDQIPPLNAAEVGEHSPPYSEALVLEGAKLGPAIRSGGSTGRRKTIAHSWSYNDRVMQLGLRALKAALPEMPRKIANCFSAGDLTGSFFFGEGIARAASCEYLPVGTRLPVPEVYDLLDGFGVDTVFATPSFFTQLFTYMQSMPRLRDLKNIMYLGETFDPRVEESIRLQYPDIRIKSLSYTTTETGPIAFQCEHQRGGDHHVNEDSVKVELLDPDTGRPAIGDEIGDVVVTTYLNDGMPMLRYKTGDRASWVNSDCSCGCPMRVIRLLGRTSSSVKICGTLILQEHVMALINRHAQVSAHDVQVAQIVSKSITEIEILIDASAPNLNLTAIRREIEQDYNFFHIKNYPGVAKLEVNLKDKSRFFLSSAGKMPFFIRVENV